MFCKMRATMKKSSSLLKVISLKSIAALVVAAAGTLFLIGCEKKGPAEKAGEKIDESVEETGDAIKDATN